MGQAVTAPPVLSENAVCIQAGGIAALDKATGKVLWRAGLGASVQSVPVLTGNVIYVASVDGEVYAIE